MPPGGRAVTSRRRATGRKSSNTGLSAAVAREAAEALAIHHEHRVRDLESARGFALRTLDHGPPGTKRSGPLSVGPPRAETDRGAGLSAAAVRRLGRRDQASGAMDLHDVDERRERRPRHSRGCAEEGYVMGGTQDFPNGEAQDGVAGAAQTAPSSEAQRAAESAGGCL